MPEDVPFVKITHLNYAFLGPNSNGEVNLPESGDRSPELLERLREMSREHEGTSFMFSISAGWYSETFSDAVLTAERRQRFERTAIDIVQEYDFNGIDIDWEYPDGTTREEDPQNVTLLLMEIRQQFDELRENEDDRQYELSMAAAPSHRTVTRSKWPISPTTSTSSA